MTISNVIKNYKSTGVFKTDPNFEYTTEKKSGGDGGGDAEVGSFDWNALAEENRKNGVAALLFFRTIGFNGHNLSLDGGTGNPPPAGTPVKPNDFLYYRMPIADADRIFSQISGFRNIYIEVPPGVILAGFNRTSIQLSSGDGIAIVAAPGSNQIATHDKQRYSLSGDSGEIYNGSAVKYIKGKPTFGIVAEKGTVSYGSVSYVVQIGPSQTDADAYNEWRSQQLWIK